jgi:hypothetical protein
MRTRAWGSVQGEVEMKPGETEPISHQIARLQRTVRWLHVERLIMLAVIAGLLAVGPAAQWWAVAKQPFAAGERGAHWAVVRTFAGLRQVFDVHPAIDPTVVLEDEREAFGVPEPGPNPAKPVAGKTLASAVHRAARKLHPVQRARFSARLASRSAARKRHHSLSAAQAGLVQAHAATRHALRHALGSGKSSSASRAATLAAQGARIGRDLDRSLALLPVNQSFQALALANLQDGGSPAAAAADAVAALPVAPVPILPVAVQSGAAPSTGVVQPAAQPVVQAGVQPGTAAAAAVPVNLKALGYAQAEDGSAQIVLSNGSSLYVVNEGQEFLDRFRVVSLSPEGVDIEDGLTHQTVHLNFGQ